MLLYAIIRNYSQLIRIHTQLIRIHISERYGQICSELHGKNFRWTVGALQALQEGAEHHTIKILDSANLCAIHARRITLMPKDIQWAAKLLDLDNNYKTHEAVTGTGGSMERERIAREEARRAAQERRDGESGRGRNRIDSDDEDDDNGGGGGVVPSRPSPGTSTRRNRGGRAAVPSRPSSATRNGNPVSASTCKRKTDEDSDDSSKSKDTSKAGKNGKVKKSRKEDSREEEKRKEAEEKKRKEAAEKKRKEAEEKKRKEAAEKKRKEAEAEQRKREEDK